MFPKVTFRQTNAFAMQYGAVMGVWGLVANACFVGSFSVPGLSMLFLLLTVSSPVLAVFLTRRFRGHVAPQGPFMFHQAFLHTLLMGVYAAIWVALGVYVYLAYFDHGFIFDAYLNSLTDPALQAEMERLGMTEQIAMMTGGGTPTDFVKALQAIPPANYAAMTLYMNLLLAPLISLFVAMACRRSGYDRTVPPQGNN